MAGIELVGLLLGAIALVEPVGKALKSASGVLKSSTSFQEYILSNSLEYHFQGRAFRNESRRIFGAFLTEPEIDDLFGGGGDSDPRWQDQAWRDSVKVHLGPVFYDELSAAMLLVFRKLSALSDGIAELKEIGDLPQPGDQIRSGGPSNYSQPDSVSIKTKSKLEIKKKDIKQHFDDLTRYNLLYQNSINNFLEEQQWRAQATTTIMKADNRRYRLAMSSRAAPWNLVSQVIDDLHEAARRLSSTLQKVASCSCHTFHLRLEMISSTDLSIPSKTLASAPCFSTRDPRYQTINFNLITLGCSSPQQPGDCHQMILDSTGRSSNRLSLRIELKPSAIPMPKLIQTTPIISSLKKQKIISSCLRRPTVSADSQTLSTQTTTVLSSTISTPKMKFKKTVAFAHNSIMAVVPSSENKKRKQVERPENPRVKPAEISETDLEPKIEVPVVPQEISDLCAWLRQLGFSGGSSNQECCPGVLKGEGDVEYLIYEDKTEELLRDEEQSSQDYGSLLHYLSSDRDILSIAQRMELAHTLAISLLRLHSSSWIQRSWSSKDVMLFLPPDATDAERRWSPYVAAAFNDLREIQEIAQAENEHVPGYKLSYVVSLGIIFLEIGLSRSLRPEQGDAFTGDPHFDAYMQACGEVKIHSVNMSMGPTYDRVVETCIKWMDADELDDKAVQQKFYEEVVLGLEKCIKVANSSQERRRQRKAAKG
ncbi:hypothetical protein TWF730_003142 [Orbilia blumenaviensis]|uniref:DUF7580 domain-containing protein n=1 Tax=Orbilia blumenaviensis TaxID=1796055 RepID=A0AAV9U7Z1_9PEZI